MCGSFLTVRDGYVYLIYQSAKDYLMGSTQTAIFPTGLEAVYSIMFSRSLEVMSATLRWDIYHLRHPGTAIEHVGTPTADPLAAVRYPCLYWVDHLVDAQPSDIRLCMDDLQDGGAVYGFLCQKYLNWLEAISLARAMPTGILAIEKLNSLLQVCSRPSNYFGGGNSNRGPRTERQTLS